MLDSQARSRTSYFKMLLAGAAAAFSVANELPSLAILPLWGLVSLRISFGKTLLGFVPGILLVAGAFFATNWLAHQSLRPPYAHRGVGNLLDSVELDAVDLTRSTPRDSLQVAQDHRASIAEKLHCEEERLSIERARSDRWLRATVAEGRKEKRFFAIVVTDTRIEIREWDDWYDYPGTYWVEGKLTGVDQGEANRMIYAVHTLIGHHGIFSLSPIWLLSLAGVWFWISQRRDYVSAVPTGAPMRDFPCISVAIISLVSLVCLFFYLSRPQIDRNYGGVSSGLRWMFWMAPLWIFVAIAAVDKLSISRLGRIVCGVFLAGSCFTVSTSLDNPWTHPWIYRLMEFLGLPL